MLIALGLGVGLVIALAGMQVLASQLYEIQPTDVGTYVVVCFAAGLRRLARVLPSRTPGDEGGPYGGFEV